MNALLTIALINNGKGSGDASVYLDGERQKGAIKLDNKD